MTEKTPGIRLFVEFPVLFCRAYKPVPSALAREVLTTRYAGARRWFHQKITFEVIMWLFKLHCNERKVTLWLIKQTVCLIRNGCANIISYSPQSIDEK